MTILDENFKPLKSEKNSYVKDTWMIGTLESVRRQEMTNNIAAVYTFWLETSQFMAEQDRELFKLVPQCDLHSRYGASRYYTWKLQPREVYDTDVRVWELLISGTKICHGPIWFNLEIKQWPRIRNEENNVWPRAYILRTLALALYSSWTNFALTPYFII